MSEYVEKRTTEIFEWLYVAYGTDSGVLFGIPAKYQTVIKSIIKLVLEEEELKREEEGTKQ